MSFVDNIPKYVSKLEQEKNVLFGKRGSIDFGSDGHWCDCEYCDREGEGGTDGDPLAQKKADKIDAEIAVVQGLIDRLTGDKPSLLTVARKES